jgi:hypothetical protein
MRRRQSHMPSQLPAVIAPPRPSPVPQPKVDVAVVDEDDDDQAETRLFRPKLDIVAATTRRDRVSSRAPQDRPSRPSRPTSRPGAMILIPADVPSVRVRSDSDVELMDTRMSEAGILPRRERGRSLSTTLLIVGLTLAVAMLVAHELALALHLPWLDPRNFFLKPR